MNTQRRSSARILPIHTPALFDEAVERAAELLRASQVVALPTETVYGLAANALDQAAVARIFEIKGRPANNPIIVHVSGVEMAKSCVAVWPASADQLARAFWPGPLTLVLPRSKQIPPIVTAGGDTVGVRWPSHPIIQAVIARCGFPLAAPSANLSGELSPTTAEHVSNSLGHAIPLIVDGGPCQIGIESTVLDLSASPPRVLRPGMIHEESLRAVIRETTSLSSSLARHSLGDSGSSKNDTAIEKERASAQTERHLPLRSPGLLPKHYAPKAKLVVLSWRDGADLKVQGSKFIRLRQGYGGQEVQGSKIHILAHTHIPSDRGFGSVSVIPHDSAAFARALYAELHRCDEAGAELIIVETPPPGDEWRAIADRLTRAANE